MENMTKYGDGLLHFGYVWWAMLRYEEGQVAKRCRRLIDKEFKAIYGPAYR